MPVCLLCALCMRCPVEARREHWILGNGITGSYDPPHMGAGKQT